jgi:hypothetical protein
MRKVGASTTHFRFAGFSRSGTLAAGGGQ